MDRRHKVELFEEIRRGYAAGETIQGLATKHEVHRRMVRQAIASVITLMRVADDWPLFMKMLNRALPRYKAMPLFDAPEGEPQP
jgi:hypothetical protein